MHFPDLEVCCDWSVFFSAQVSRRSWGRNGDEPLRTSVWEAIDYLHVNILSAVIHSRCFLKTIIFEVQKKHNFLFQLL